jgi:aldehyde dehydrogenase (NAD+)
MIEEIFQAQKANQQAIAMSTSNERKRKLQMLIDAVSVTYRDDIRSAMYADFGKAATEVDMTEIFATVGEIKFIKRRVSDWMDIHPVGTPLPLIGSSSWVKYEPKGVCLIISPWNFPILLTLAPLASAIAAGNTAILKPSEMTPHTSALMAKMIRELFPSDQVALIEGGVEASTELLALPFDHIFFTGSPKVGKIVMTAAAKHLASVTLELGGKSPTVIDETANLKAAAKRIAWAKFINAGQVCIAPDYVIVQEKVLQPFLEAMKHEITDQYGSAPQDSPDYTRMVDGKHHARVCKMLEHSLNQGGQLAFGGHIDATTKTLSPTLVVNPPLSSPLMLEEIFGPVLPIVSFNQLDEVAQLIRSKEKPLALYIYSQSKKNINYLIQQTSAGTTCINHSAIHFFNGYLPFGGANNSGLGRGHGFAGFQEFSNSRAFFRQHIVSITDLLKPPYRGWKQKVLNLAIKYL